MVRGGGGAAGGAFANGLMELLAAIASMPPGQLLSIAIGLLLMIVIFVQLRRSPSTAPRKPAVRPTTCLLCSQSLSERSYVDRYVPGWVACEPCYSELPASKQRQYQPLEAA